MSEVFINVELSISEVSSMLKYLLVKYPSMLKYLSVKCPSNTETVVSINNETIDTLYTGLRSIECL